MEGGILMRPMQISAETAIKLAEQLKVPVEQIMHMPKHILLAKLAELEAKQQENKNE
jgi:plasmid maintenance system antidote protein VapI